MQMMAYFLLFLCIVCIAADFRFSAHVSKRVYPAGALFAMGMVFGGIGLGVLDAKRQLDAYKAQQLSAIEARLLDSLCYSGSGHTYLIDSSGKQKELRKCNKEGG